MTPEKMKQIEADAEAYRNNLGLEPHSVYLDLIKDAYIAGRTAEAEKAAALVEALEWVRNNFGMILNSDNMANKAIDKLNEALNNYKKQ